MFSRTCCRKGDCAAEWLPTILRSWIQHVTVIKANNTVLIFIMRSTSETWMIRKELPEKAIKVPQDLLSVQHCWWEKYFRTPKKFFFFCQKFRGLATYGFIIITVNWTFCRLHSACLDRKREWKQKSSQHKDQHEILLFVRSTAAISAMLCWLFSSLLTHCI